MDGEAIPPLPRTLAEVYIETSGHAKGPFSWAAGGHVR